MNAALLVSALACDVSSDIPPVGAPAPQAPPAAVAAMIRDPDEGAAPYHYSPVGKRDPFRAIVDAAAGPLAQPIAYRVLGVVWDIDTPQALVAGADGRSFVVEEGGLLGDSWGRIARISPEGVEVVTEYLTLSGDTVEQRTVLRLRGG